MIDAENLELYLLGDLNCNLLSDTPSTNTSGLLNIFTTYNLNQLITEPTRVTNNSQTLIDLCVTNTPDKVRASCVLSIGISDHSLVYLVRKSTCSKPVINLSVKKRCFKNFNETAYLNDLCNLNWNVVYTLHDLNSMWDKGLNLLTSVIDKHAPIKKKRLGRRKSPWITAELIHKMRLRDNLKKRFDMTHDDELWGQYKKARNDCNNLFNLFSFPTRAGSPQQREPITVGPYYLTHPVNFPCGRKPEYPKKTHDFRQSVDYALFT